MSDTHQFSGDAAAYVIGALELDELQAFRTHLESCPICRDEVAALQQVADTLPMAAPQYEAPKHLRQRVLADVRSEPRCVQPVRRRRWPTVHVPSPVLAFGLAAVLALAVVGVIELASGGSSDVRVIPAHTTFASASAEIRLGDGRSELVVAHMPAPAVGHIYEVWLKRAGAAPSPTNALFSVSTSGAATVGLPGSLHGVSQVLVTPEPDGGSPAPTHPPVIVGSLT
jgi:anti-sigma-K factor RskA